MNLDGEGIGAAGEGVALPVPVDAVDLPMLAIGAGDGGAVNDLPGIEKAAAVQIGHDDLPPPFAPAGARGRGRARWFGHIFIRRPRPARRQQGSTLPGAPIAP